MMVPVLQEDVVSDYAGEAPPDHNVLTVASSS